MTCFVYAHACRQKCVLECGALSNMILVALSHVSFTPTLVDRNAFLECGALINMILVALSHVSFTPTLVDRNAFWNVERFATWFRLLYHMFRLRPRLSTEMRFGMWSASQHDLGSRNPYVSFTPTLVDRNAFWNVERLATWFRLLYHMFRLSPRLSTEMRFGMWSA
jgi:hypothetical protein